jgi:hypothetical protein
MASGVKKEGGLVFVEENYDRLVPDFLGGHVEPPRRPLRLHDLLDHPPDARESYGLPASTTYRGCGIYSSFP